MKNKRLQLGHGIDKDINAFKNNKVNWGVILMSGGEPFIYPDYVELCSKLSELAKIAINTNLSTTNVYDFADKINPKKVVEIHVSLHLGQRPRRKWGEFVKKYNYLKDYGFPICATQVYHPKLMREFDEAYHFFEEQGITIIPKAFEGYNGFRLYPTMYTGAQREQMLRYAKKYDLPSIIYGYLDWYHKTCSAGYKSLQIQYDGDAFRCQTDATYLGNLYKGDIEIFKSPQICNMKRCKCAYEGMYAADNGQHIQKHVSPVMYMKSAVSEYLTKIRNIWRGT